jgi:predicted CoA-binding protein
MHGHGIATLLLEYLVSVARQHQILVFTAETLGENSAMLAVFADAGLPVRRKVTQGVVELVIPLPAGDGDPAMPRYADAVSRRESHADVASLRHLLAPASVAVIGASRRADAVGTQILRNIKAGGFAGRIYPVNPHADEVAGVPCVRAIADLPDDVDLAIVTVPAAAVPDVAGQCGQRGVRSLVVVTSGLGAAGPELLAACREYGMRLVGPNCFGIAVPGIGLDATFGRDRPLAGTAGLVVQSGGIGVSLTEHLSRLGIGISSFASVGDKYDVSGNDLLAWWEQDQQTRLGAGSLWCPTPAGPGCWRLTRAPMKGWCSRRSPSRPGAGWLRSSRLVRRSRTRSTRPPRSTRRRLVPAWRRLPPIPESTP